MAFVEDFTGRNDDRTLLLTATTADAIEIGDDLYWDAATFTARPASSQADQGSLLLNQQLYAINRLGVARSAKVAAVAGTVVVDVNEGMLHQFPATSAIYRAMTYVNLNEIAAGTALNPDELIAVVNRDDAIAVVVDDSAVARTTIQVRFIRSVASGNMGAPRAQQAAGILSGAQVLTINSPPFLSIDPGGGAINVDLPAEAASVGRWHIISNTADAAEAITMRNDAAGTVIVIDQDECGIVYCDGTNWEGLTGPEA